MYTYFIINSRYFAVVIYFIDARAENLLRFDEITQVFNLQDMFRRTCAIFGCRSSLSFRSSSLRSKRFAREVRLESWDKSKKKNLLPLQLSRNNSIGNAC